MLCVLSPHKVIDVKDERKIYIYQGKDDRNDVIMTLNSNVDILKF